MLLSCSISRKLKYHYIDFHNPKGAALGILTASLALGAIVGIPFMTFVGDRYGRRMAIFTGATFMLIGAAIQAGSQNSESNIRTPI